MDKQAQQPVKKMYVMRYVFGKAPELHTESCRDLKKIWQYERRKHILAYSAKRALIVRAKNESIEREQEIQPEGYYKIGSCIHE